MFAEDILEVISGQNFADFYGYVEEGDNCPFTLYLEGADEAPSKDEILDKICDLFHVERRPK